MSGRIPALVKAIKNHAVGPNGLFKDECMALFELCKDNTDNMHCAQKAGGLEALANAMAKSEHYNDGNLQAVFCNILLSICSSRDPSATTCIDIAQVTSTIVGSMKRHQNEDLHMSGLQAIAYMASTENGWTEADLKQVMKQHDLAEAVTTSMQTHQRHFVIQGTGARLVSILVRREDTLMEQFLSRKAGSMILGAMDFNLKNLSGTRRLLDNPQVLFRDCCFAVARFYGHPPQQGQFVRVSDANLDRYSPYEDARIGTLCRVINAYRNENEVQLMAVLAVCACTEQSSKNRRLLGRTTIALLMELCCEVDNHADLKLLALRAMLNLVRDCEGNSMLFAEASASQALIRVMEINMHVPSMASKIIRVMEQASRHSPDAAQALIRAGGIHAIQKAMDTHKQKHDDESLLKEGVNALESIVHPDFPPDVASLILTGGPANAILHALDRINDSLSFTATECLGQILNYYETPESIESISTLAIPILAAAVEKTGCGYQAQYNACVMMSEIMCRTPLHNKKTGQDLCGRRGILAICSLLKKCVQFDARKCQFRVLSDSPDSESKSALEEQKSVIEKSFHRFTAPVMLALSRATSNHTQNQNVCAEVGAIDMVLQAMKKHKNDAQIQLDGARTLGGLSLCHAENTALIVSKGGLKRILRAMKSATSSDDIRLCHIVLGQFQQVDKTVPAALQVTVFCEHLKMVEACVSCGKTREEISMRQLLHCSACTVAPKYCSVECQKASWPAHKAECKANRKRA
jgi:hypothetical protein